MNSDNLTTYYYDFLTGQSPSEENFNKTNLTFKHLIDAGLNKIELHNLINKLPYKEEITFNDIPDSLWDNSLLERDKFYFHKELQIQSPPPTWDETFPFFLEMKIRYTLDDILEYFTSRANVRKEWINKEKEIGSIKYLLKTYKKFDFIEPIDFLLHLIDYSVSDGLELNSIYDLGVNEIKLAEYLEVDIANARSMKKDTIVWRS